MGRQVRYPREMSARNNGTSGRGKGVARGSSKRVGERARDKGGQAGNRFGNFLKMASKGLENYLLNGWPKEQSYEKQKVLKKRLRVSIKKKKGERKI